jgi:phosphoribosylaminoimidazolecarboxamide formyltransferase/IMP cyclohydrolase
VLARGGKLKARAGGAIVTRPKSMEDSVMAANPKVERALITVSDKTGLAEFARGIVKLGVELFSTGGTRRHLADAGIPVRDVAEYTGFPEMMDGRVKTLHPKIHGGILCRRDHAEDMEALDRHGIASFELVVVNLYPFEKTVAKPGVTIDEAIENIDIGGPSLTRSAAKNHAFVTIATDASQYAAILAQLREHGATTPELRRELAAAAFARTAEYDAAIAAYFQTILPREGSAGGQPPQPASSATLQLQRRTSLRYGENPHQTAALYAFADAGSHALINARQLHGKELSYNNLLDLDAALACVRFLPRPSIAVLKHNNPCGAATAATVAEAAAKAWDGDPLSAFGSVLGVNAPVDAAMAEFLAEPGKFVEAIIAPEFKPDAIQILTTKPKWRDNVRLLAVGAIEPGRGTGQWRQIDGGMLWQDADDLPDDESQWQVVSDTQPSAALHDDMAFAWTVCRHVKSNAIVLVRDGALVGAGAGQMSRVDSVEIAIRKAGGRSQGAVLASDAFFPFDDSIHAAAQAGVAAVIQPGGSRRDDEVIAACNKYGLPMIFTGRRHFRH